MREVGLDISRNSLNVIEWNALTYAGHMVLNVHNEGYVGGTKRRPREEGVNPNVKHILH
jgi:hypothetical protein